MRFYTWCLIALLLGGCAAPSGTGSQPIAPPATSTASIAAATPQNSPAGATATVPSTPTAVSAAASPTVAALSAPANTAAPATVASTVVPAAAAPRTPAGAAVALTPTELKYRLIEQYGIFYCPAGGSPPTSYDETDQALASFSTIQKDAEVYGAILAHDQLSSAAGFTTQQKLLIYRDYSKLGPVTLTRARDAYTFSLRTTERLQGVVLTGSITPQGVSTVSGRQQVVNRCTA